MLLILKTLKDEWYAVLGIKILKVFCTTCKVCLKQWDMNYESMLEQLDFTTSKAFEINYWSKGNDFAQNTQWENIPYQSCF